MILIGMTNFAEFEDWSTPWTKAILSILQRL